MSHRFVTRVVDYEPKPVLASLPPTACRVPRHATLHQPSRARPVGVERQVHRPAAEVPPRVLAFADGALRRVLEALDRRRPLAQLRPLLADGPLSAVTAYAARGPFVNSARLQKIRVRACSEQAAELFGTYQRGDRVGAIAGRLECTDDRWLLVALQIG